MDLLIIIEPIMKMEMESVGEKDKNKIKVFIQVVSFTSVEDICKKN